MNDGPEPNRVGGLDPDRAARRSAEGKPSPGRLPAAVDPRPFRWAIGIFALVLIISFSIFSFATRGVGTAGVPAGSRLHFFAAPLAASNLEGDANLQPPCTPADHDPRALNICLLSQRAPLVLAFFVTGSPECVRQIDTMESVAAMFPAHAVEFAAVAVAAGRAATYKLVRAHRWTIPVAYDRDGGVGQAYSVAVCPLLELAHRGGVVAQRLIGGRWLSVPRLANQVRILIGQSRSAGQGRAGGS